MDTVSKNLLEKYAEVLYEEINSNEMNIFNIQEEIKYHSDILNSNQKLLRFLSLESYSLKNYYIEGKDDYIFNERNSCNFNIEEATKNINNCTDKLKFHLNLITEKIMAYKITQDKLFFRDNVIEEFFDKVNNISDCSDLYELKVKSKKLIKKLYNLQSFEKINDKFNKLYDFFCNDFNVYNTFKKINDYLILENIKIMGFTKLQSFVRKRLCSKKYNLLKKKKNNKLRNNKIIIIQSFYRCYKQMKKYISIKKQKKISLDVSKAVIKNLINRTMNIIKKKEKKILTIKKEENDSLDLEIKLDEKENDESIKLKNEDCVKRNKKNSYRKKKKKKNKLSPKNNKIIDKIDDDEFNSLLEEFRNENTKLIENSKRKKDKLNSKNIIEQKIEKEIIESKNIDSTDYVKYLIFNHERNKIIEYHRNILNNVYITQKQIKGIFEDIKKHNFFSEIKIRKFIEFIIEVKKLSTGLEIIQTNDTYKVKVISALDNTMRLKNFFVNQNALYYKMRFDLLLMKSDLLFISKLMKRDFDSYKPDKLDILFDVVINYPFSNEAVTFLEGLIKYYDDSTELIFNKVLDKKKPTFALIQILISFYHINYHRLYRYVRTCANIEFYTNPISYENIPNIKDQYGKLKNNLLSDWKIFCKKKKIKKDKSIEKEYKDWKLVI